MSSRRHQTNFIRETEIALQVEKVGPNFFKFQSMSILKPSVASEDRKQFPCLNIVLRVCP